MQFIRKLSLAAAAALLFVLLFTFGLAFSAYRVFSTPDTIKSALKDSGFYQSAVANALQHAQKEQSTPAQAPNEIPISHPAVQNIIKEAASPEFLQTQSEQALDSVYAWLRGESPDLRFTVDLATVKTRLADGMANYVQQHLATLPACAPGTAPVGAGFDPFNAVCLPPGTTPEQVAAETRSQILNGEFLKDSTQITADTIKTEDGKTLAQQLRDVPETYQRLTWAIYGAGILALLMALAVVFLSTDRRSGLSRASMTFIIVGTISALMAWLSSFGVQRGALALADQSGGIAPLQRNVMDIAQELVNDLRTWWMGYGLVLIVLGIVTLIISRFMRPKAPSADKEKPAAPATAPTPPPAATPAAPVPSQARSNMRANKPRPRPPKKLVQ
jgi:hypothetical protein